jgi:hypothetical protein
MIESHSSRCLVHVDNVCLLFETKALFAILEFATVNCHKNAKNFLITYFIFYIIHYILYMLFCKTSQTDNLCYCYTNLKETALL